MDQNWLHKMALFLKEIPRPERGRKTGFAVSWEIKTGAVWAWQTGERAGGQGKSRAAQVRPHMIFTAQVRSQEIFTVQIKLC